MWDIVYESCPWHKRVALLDGMGRLRSVHIDDESRHFIEGAMVLGRVRKQAHGLGGYFVDIGDEKDALLPFTQLPKSMSAEKLTEGQPILVRVVREAMAEKGVRLSANVMPPPHFSAAAVKPPCMVKEAPCALSRALMAAGATPVRVWVLDNRFVAEVAALVPQDHIFKLSDHKETDLLETLDAQLEALESPAITGPGGIVLTVETTRALTSIDVDSGPYRAREKGRLPQEVNELAAEEIARLCRLLDIGGSILIDFISMKSREDRRRIKDMLVEGFARYDNRRVDVLEMSRFGVLEINREKAGMPLYQRLKQPVYKAGGIMLSLMRQAADRQQDLVVPSDDEQAAKLLKQRLTPDMALALFGRAVQFK